MKNNLKTIFLVAAAFLLSILLCVVLIQYPANCAIGMEEAINTAKSDIKIREKNRLDKVGNLAECVMQYDKHEAEVLQNLAERRTGSAEGKNISNYFQAVAESYPELQSSGQYQVLMLELVTLLIIREEYQEHIKTKTYQTESGETVTETEIYYSWDETSRDYNVSETFLFMGKEFLSDRFDLPEGDYIDTVKASIDVRYIYYGVPEEMEGTLYTVLKDGTIGRGSQFYPEKTITQTIEFLESSMNWLFWVIWVILTGCVIFVFCYLENKWLK